MVTLWKSSTTPIAERCSPHYAICLLSYFITLIVKSSERNYDINSAIFQNYARTQTVQKHGIYRFYKLELVPKSVENNLDERNGSCFSFPWIKIKTTRNLAEFYEFSFARCSVSSRNSWPCCCNRLKKPAAANSIAASLYVHILWAQKKSKSQQPPK